MANYTIENTDGQQFVVVNHPHLTIDDFRTYITYQLHVVQPKQAKDNSWQPGFFNNNKNSIDTTNNQSIDRSGELSRDNKMQPQP